MSKRNISNGNEIEDISSNYMEIQNNGVGFIVYNTDINNPFLKVDLGANLTLISGDLTVTGNMNVSTMNVSEFDAGILHTAATNNTSDVLDIGISGRYFNGTSVKYTGIVRDADDILQRWILYKDIDTEPADTVSNITSSTLDSLRLNAIYVNNGTAATPSIVFDWDTNKDTGFYRITENTIGVTSGGSSVFSIGPTNSTFTNGQILNVGTSGTSSPLNVYGLTTIYNGLIVNTGTTTLQTLTTAGLITAAAGLTVSTGQILNVGISGASSPLNVYGPITGSLGLNISSGTTTLQTLTTAGLITASAGITVATGQTLNIGTTGTTSPLNVYGLATVYNGFIVTSGLSSLQTLTTAGLITANAGITVTTGQTLNVGTSGTTSPFNVYGLITGSFGLNISGSYVSFSGPGSTNSSNGTLSILPTSTIVSGSSNFYFTALKIPVTTGSTTGSAYTFYVEGAPSGTITTPYTVYIAAGKTYIGGALQIPTGANNGYLLTSDINGNVSWTPPKSTTFPDGTVSAPSITFTSDLTTGLYRIGASNIGITTGGVKRFDISNTLTQISTDLKTTSGYSRNIAVNSNTSVTLTSSDNFIEFSSSTNITVTLPPIASNPGREYTLVKIGTGNITINTANSSEFIDDGVTTSISLTTIYNRVTLVCASTQWYSM